MCSAHTSAMPLKDNRLWNQVPTSASTLARTSDQFCSSLNHAPRMQTGLSPQRWAPSSGKPPLQAPNCRPSLLSKLTFAPVISSYLSTTFFTASMSNCILADFNNPLIWMVSVRPPISSSSSPLYQVFGDSSECTNYNWHHRHGHVPLLF